MKNYNDRKVVVSMQKKQNKKKTALEEKKVIKTNIILGVVAVVIIAMVVFAIRISNNSDKLSGGQAGGAAPSSINENGDLVIPVAGITEKATFYVYDGLDSKMEILAVKASDGTIRTAFNTCQDCYHSGRGYYVQEGDVLVCQNCRNTFQMDQVEMTAGGCNPVPISEEGKDITDTSITISKDFLLEAETMFASWKI